MSGLYHISDNPHSHTMLMAYFPAERVVVQVDAFSPGAQGNPYAANLLENMTKRGLRVDRIVPLHGSIVRFAELVQIAETDELIGPARACGRLVHRGELTTRRAEGYVSAAQR